MATARNLLQELARLRDELNLEAHLMSMEWADEWRQLQDKIHQLETNLEHTVIDLAEKFGHAEEQFFVDTDENIDKLVNELRSFKQKLKP